MSGDPKLEDSNSDVPAEGGGGPSDLPEFVTPQCEFNGRKYNLNDRICDAKRVEWQCGTRGKWVRTGRVCPG